MNWQPAADRYDAMVYNRCGRSGLRLPALSLGLWHNFGDDSPFEMARAMVRRAFDLGISHFDLANNYGPPPGSAEETFGRVLATGCSDGLALGNGVGFEVQSGQNVMDRLLLVGRVHEKAFGRMPILADALQDAGCDNDEILSHCLREGWEHVRGCWVLDLVLGHPWRESARG